jgi:hypothetical protein
VVALNSWTVFMAVAISLQLVYIVTAVCY